MNTSQDQLLTARNTELEKELLEKTLQLEQKNHEAEIEVALERVRNRSMGMQKSEELLDVIQLVYEEFCQLNFNIQAANFFVDYTTSNDFNMWLTTSVQKFPTSVHVPYFDHTIFKCFAEAKEKGKNFYTVNLTFEEKNEFHDHFFKNVPGVSAEAKEFAYKVPGYAISVSLEKNIGLCILNFAGIPYSSAENAILLRFSKVFEQTYTRFLDLQKAETQARETDIELSLERVRAKMMAMQKPSEFVKVINIIGEQFIHLGFDIDWVNFGANGLIISEGIDIWNFAVIPGASPISARVFIPYFDHPVFSIGAASVNEYLNSGKDFFMMTLDKQTKDTWLDHIYNNTIFKEVPQELRKIQYDKPGYSTSNITLKDTWLSIGKFDTKTFTDEQNAILKRFANAFGQAYIRFLDLQKAEAQARESQIQLALERVRARTMAMQKSEELAEAARVLYEEFRTLDINTFLCGYCFYKEEQDKQTVWVTFPDGTIIPDFIDFPITGDHVLNKRYEDWKQKKPLHVLAIQGEENKEHHRFLASKVSDQAANEIFAQIPDRIIVYCANFSTGYLFIIATEFLTGEEEDVIIRFAKVFELTYTRFSDLKQAELQAREAQIQLALERVRARTMAMQHSDELKEAANLLFLQVKELGIHAWTCGYSIWDEDRKASTVWTSSEGTIQPPFKTPSTEYPTFKHFYEAAQRGESLFVEEMGGEVLKAHYSYMRTLPGLGGILDNVRKAGFSPPTFQVNHAAFFSYGYLLFITYERYPEAHDIFKRFSKVFEQTYTRFLDLQKAEAQARESQIQLALERVRSRAMSMYHSDELNEVLSVLIEQFDVLGICPMKAVLSLFDPQKNTFTFRTTGKAGQRIIGEQIFDINSNELFKEIFRTWEKSKPNSVFTNFISKEDLPQVWQLFPNTFAKMPEEAWVYPADYPDGLYNTFGYCKFGFIGFDHTRAATIEEENITIRFANEFERLYQRFLDLQKAEAQARESQIQLALERVRARTMAMQRSDELGDAASLLFKQIADLGTRQWSSGFDIWNANEISAVAWMSNPDGSMGKPFNVPYTEDPFFKKIYEARQTGEDFFVMESSGKELEETYQYLFNLPEAKKHFDGVESLGFQIPTFQITHCAFFSHGYLMFITFEAAPEMWDIFKRFAKVFEQTYTRFLDLQTAEAQTRESQIQLALERVRARTMAMQRSDELQDTAALLFQQANSLSITHWACGFNVYDDDRKTATSWMASEFGKGVNSSFKVPTNEHIFKHIYEASETGESLYIHEIKSDKIEAHYRYMFTLPVAGDRLKAFVASGGVLPAIQILHAAFFSHGYLLFITQEPVPEMHSIFKRFAKVFEQTYTRFLDLQKAEAQARESQIQLALERVRARTMAMQRSDELMESANLLFQQVQSLGIPVWSCGYNIWEKGEKFCTGWMSTRGAIQPSFRIPLTEYRTFIHMNESRLKAEPFYIEEVSGEELADHYRYMFSLPDFKEIATKQLQDGFPLPLAQINHVFNFKHGNLVFLSAEAMPGAWDIFKRFTAVFEQTYTRFLDLQKAEAQAREAQIELGLERVRARAMAMQKSEELKYLISTVSTELGKLDIQIDRSFIVTYDTNTMDSIWWMANPETPNEPNGLHVPYHEHPAYLAHIEAWKERKVKWVYLLEGDTKKTWGQFLFYQTELSKLPAVVSKSMMSLQKVYLSTSFNNFGYLQIGTLEPLSDEQFNIMSRFAKVFDLTYTRFNDLKQAEAQLRESQIEAALERVRTIAMGMRQPDDMLDVCHIISDQLQILNIKDIRNVQTIIIYESKHEYINYQYFAPYNKNSVEQIDYRLHPVELELAEKMLSSEEAFYSKIFQGEDLQIWRDHRKATNQLPDPLLDEVEAAYYYFYSIGTGGLGITAYSQLSEEALVIFKRFRNVFELAYKRYIDIELALNQARESQIQLALERVRARTMAMQHSDELKNAAALLFQQVKSLGVPAYSCGYNIWEKDDKEFTSWMSTQDGSEINGVPNIPLTEDANFIRYVESKRKGEPFFVLELRGERMQEHYQYLKTIPAFKGYFDYAVSVGFDLPEIQIHHLANFSHGNLLFITLQPCPQFHDVFKRFAAVFDQTYTRFLDLKKAEAQALDAVKRASVDRVRAEIASMRTTNDLERITPLIWNELTTLSVPFIRCGVFIMDDERQQIETHLSTPDGEALAAFNLPYNAPGETAQILAHWQKKELYKQHWNEAQFVEFTQNLVQQGAVTSGEKYLTENHPTDLYLHFLPFLQGMLYAGNTAPLNDDALHLMQNLADAFATAYARYEDFNKLEDAKSKIETTLGELKATQHQLIQSEKMASLGELTAGIAHEIQNPLNFVNNFSEVSNEMIDEMKEELATGNLQLATEIADDIKQNLEKINHHGKRADAIVKGMLQHSRKSEGVKEPTDINALCDEYLRLSYHGLRAKDKSFNADFKTDFDAALSADKAGIGKVNIVPQDIGRVLLNLYNNAFYAVSEKQKAQSLKQEDYKPLVFVTTRKINSPSGVGGIEIRVKDNGNGIPQSIVDKIFQPFFTTKPTGQGTGLGLSLSYDIIKVHGGGIKVETKEGEGSEFIIQLPVRIN